MPGVRSCYDEGKRTAETLTMDYHRGANVEVSILIFFINFYYFKFFLLYLFIYLLYYSLPMHLFLHIKTSNK